MEKSRPSEGPNQILPSDHFTTTNVFSCVKVRMGDTGLAKVPPISIPGILDETVATAPDRQALAYKKNPQDKEFQYVTFREYQIIVKTVAKAFLKLGLQKLHAVGILGFNSPEWFYSYLGCIHAGGIAVGIYTTNSAEATFYCLEKSLANIAVVEDESQAQKVLRHKDQLPRLKAIIQYCGKPAEGVLSWEELMNIGKNENDTALNEALKKIAINECCTLIYTSGTTGFPKGVMLSHDNLIWNALSVLAILGMSKDERMISYLPLSHVAALMVDIFCHILRQVTIYFANKDALKGGLINTLLEVKPTRFLAVPRIWEKITETLKTISAESGFVKKHISAWAKGRGLQRHLDLMNGNDNPSYVYLLARSLIFSKVKTKLGFDNCKTFWSGAAPLSWDVKLYLASLDIPVMEGFGMSECAGAHTINVPSAFRFDSAGRTLPGAKTKIENPDNEQQGEICIYGRHVFMGYLEDPSQTKEAVDSCGWLRSGDIGYIDPHGHLFITGRIKELLITAGGENIAPVLIEQNIKAELPCLGHAVVICEKRKFLSVLLTFSNEVNNDTGEASDKLTSSVILWLKDLGFSFTTSIEIMDSGPDKKILDAIQKGIDAANEKAISNAQKVQKFAILPKDFSISTGELGPTLKLKRTAINEKYREIIDKFYES